jgi:hypothetical protein
MGFVVGPETGKLFEMWWLKGEVRGSSLPVRETHSHPSSFFARTVVAIVYTLTSFRSTWKGCSENTNRHETFSIVTRYQCLLPVVLLPEKSLFPPLTAYLTW